MYLDGKERPVAALSLGLAFFLFFLFRRLPGMAVIAQDISQRTVVFETLSLCGGALVLARVLPPEPVSLRWWNDAAEKLASPGRYLLAVSMAIFGIDHFQVAGFIAALIPSWIPWHSFFTYASGVGFLAAGLAFALDRHLRLAGTVLGIMFVLWVVVLHAPRVAAHWQNGNEWNSAIVALAMSGCAFVVAGLPREEAVHTNVLRADESNHQLTRMI